MSNVINTYTLLFSGSVYSILYGPNFTVEQKNPPYLTKQRLNSLNLLFNQFEAKFSKVFFINLRPVMTKYALAITVFFILVNFVHNPWAVFTNILRQIKKNCSSMLKRKIKLKNKINFFNIQLLFKFS